jgi:AraC-like DNA-binding protein
LDGGPARARGRGVTISLLDRFTRTVGVAPMEYLLAWRMAVAKDLLRREELVVGDVAEHVGYGSASTFSTAVARHVGIPPSRYAVSVKTQTDE